MQGKKIGLVLVAVGIVLILAALGLALRNQQEDHAAGEQALQLFHQLQGSRGSRRRRRAKVRQQLRTRRCRWWRSTATAISGR